MVVLLQEVITDASKRISQKVDAEETKYTLMSCHQNAGKNHNIKIANRSFKSVALELQQQIRIRFMRKLRAD
jgi:hypothetical protein